jgi:predicted GNAT superfamily acetyltransferase
MTEATDAAAAAGIDIDFAPSGVELVGFLETIWGSPGDPSLYLAVVHAGNSVLLARRDGVVVGAALGVLGWEGGLHVHSHMVAVAPGIRSSGIGFAIKLAQREQALGYGVAEMRWTFDPLIRRNAHFNLVKLGAVVTEFLPNFYGSRDDTINVGDVTDRFEVSWRLDEPVGAAPFDGHDDLGLPADYERLRIEDPAAARAVRAASSPILASSSVRFTGTGYSIR